MLTYPMNQRDDKAKYYYLYSAIKEDIVSGVIKKNEKLPSKRSLAEHLGISLITVETAYQMLKEEGYIESRERSGYFVTELTPVARQKCTERKLELLEEARKADTTDTFGGTRKADETGDKGNSTDDAEVDFKTESEIIKNILKNYREKTIIYVSHKNHESLFMKTINLESANEF